MNRTTYLVQNGSLLSGLCRSIDLFGGYTDYNRSGSPHEADVRGLARDFEAIGEDLWTALSEYKTPAHQGAERGR